MKSRHMTAMLVALSVSTAAFAADNGEALFNQKKCSTCHKLDVRGVGPTLKALSAKYGGDKDALPKLEAKVRSGGSGVWGGMPMPRIPASTASDDEVRAIVTWMISHK